MNKSEREDLSKLFAMFSDPTRLKILNCLKEGEQNVSNLSILTDLTISNVSHQLKLLELQRLVKKEKRGKYVYYELDDIHVLDIFNIGLEHIRENNKLHI